MFLPGKSQGQGSLVDCNTPGFPIHHQLLELAQTHVNGVNDDFQPFHPLSSPSPTSISPSIRVFFQQVNSSHQVVKGLEFQVQYQSFH